MPGLPALESLQPVAGRIAMVKEHFYPGKHAENEIHVILEGLPALFIINKGDNLVTGNWLDDHSLDYDAIKATLKKNDDIKLWALRLPGHGETYDTEFYENRNSDEVVNTGYDNPAALNSFSEQPAPKTIRDLPNYEVLQLIKDGQVLIDYRTMTAAYSGLKKLFQIIFIISLFLLGCMLVKYTLAALMLFLDKRKAKNNLKPE